MKNIRTVKQLNEALKDGLCVYYGEKCGHYEFYLNVKDDKGGQWVPDTKLVRDLVIKCRERGLLKFGY